MDLITLALAKKETNEVKAGLTDVTRSVNQTVINADIGLKKWRTAMADIRCGLGSTIYNLNFIGDSISEAQYTTNYNIDSGFVGVVRNKLITKYFDNGKGFVGTNYPRYGTRLWTFDASFNPYALGNFGLYRDSMTTTTALAVASISLSGTEIRVVMQKNSMCGSFTATVDGVDKGSFNCNNTTDSVGEFVIATGLTDETHALVITKSNNTNALIIIGAYGTKGTKGIRVNRMARAGMGTTDATYNAEVLSAEFNSVVLKPTLTIIELGANDVAGDVPLETYRANLQILITKALTVGDCLLMSVLLSSAFNTISKQLQYMSVMKELAILNNCAFVDTAGRWGNTEPPASFISSQGHWSDIGHQDVASALLRVLDEY